MQHPFPVEEIASREQFQKGVRSPVISFSLDGDIFRAASSQNREGQPVLHCECRTILRTDGIA
jgi:hypothetical protein